MFFRQEHSVLSPFAPVDKQTKKAEAAAGTPEKQEPLEELQIIGQLFSTYILAQKGDRFYMIDQHAAHERILYEKFMKQYETGEGLSQPLLTPVIIELTPLERETVEANLHLFTELGFSLEEFGPLSFAVREVPFILGAPQAEAFFREFLDNINQYTAREAVARKRERLITMSCKKAIKGGERLDEKEIKALIRMLEEGNTPLTCPHGRPIVTSMSKQEIEKAFGRRV